MRFRYVYLCTALAVLLMLVCATPVLGQEATEKTGTGSEAVGAAAQKAEKAEGMKAEDLIRAAQRGVTAIIKATRESKDPKLEPDEPDAKPFWQAVKRLNEALDKAERGLYLKDETFTGALGDAGSAMAEADVTFEMTGSKSGEVEDVLSKTAAAVALLVRNYSKEAARLQQGGELTPEERKQFEKMKEEQAELKKKLTELEGKVGANSHLINGVQRAQRESDRIHNAPYTTNGFVDAMVTINILRGWMWGWHWWWGPWAPWCPDYVFVMNDFYHDTIIIFDYDWGIVDMYADLEMLDAIDGWDDWDDVDLDFEVNDAEHYMVDGFLEEHSFDLEGTEHLEVAGDYYDFGDVGVGTDDVGVGTGDVGGGFDEHYMETMDVEPQVDFYQPQGLPMDDFDMGGFDSGFDFDAGGFDAGGFDD